MMPHLELWQWMATLGGFLVVTDRVFGALERLGIIPSRAAKWLQRRWLERIEQEARDHALDALLSNGISHKVDAAAAAAAAASEASVAAVAKVHDVATLTAQHIVESNTAHHRIEGRLDILTGIDPEIATQAARGLIDIAQGKALAIIDTAVQAAERLRRESPRGGGG